MRPLRAGFLLTVALATPPLAAQDNTLVPIRNFEVPWGREGRPRDPAVHPDGSIFFVGQTGNYLARLDPANGTFKKFEVDENAHPHSCIVDAKGMVWYSGNTNGTIGRLDPKTGAVERWTIPDGVKDPHTMIWDRQGNMWFTAQNSNVVGHFNVTTKAFRLAKMPMPNARPYGIVLDSKGNPWFNLFGTNLIGTIDPKTLELKTFPVGDERTRDRRIGITPDDKLWYTDYSRGYLGNLDPATGKSEEWALPGGANSLPYGMTVDDRGRVWVAEANPSKPNRLVGFDPKTKAFFSVTEIPGERNTVRYMIFDRRTKSIWFGADAGIIGKADVSGTKVTM